MLSLKNANIDWTKSLEIDVSLLRCYYSAWFLQFYTIPSLLRRLSSERKLQ